MGGSARRFGTDIVQQLVQEGAVLPAFPGASLRDIARTKMGLKVGYLSTSGKFLAMVDLLESRGYLKILMHPTLEVVNGKTAKLISKEYVPLQTTYLRSVQQDWFESKTEYIDVIDSLEITPHVFVGDGSIALETNIVLGAKSTPEGVKQVSIITTKEINNKENRIRQGESLVIGGIRKCLKHEVVRGIPVLKDLPGLGVLFSSKDFEERVVETIFVLTPTISTGGIPTEEINEAIRRRHQAPSPGVLHEAIMDPFGFLSGEEEQQRKADEAEKSRIEAEEEKTETRHTIREANRQAERAKAEAEKANTEATKAKTELERLKAELQKLKEAEAEKNKAEPKPKPK